MRPPHDRGGRVGEKHNRPAMCGTQDLRKPPNIAKKTQLVGMCPTPGQYWDRLLNAISSARNKTLDVKGAPEIAYHKAVAARHGLAAVVVPAD